MALVVGPTRWNFIERDPYNRAALLCPLGTTLSDGSSLICKNAGIAWFVAPSASQVGRSWDNRNDAVTTAQALTGCTDWFVPSSSLLLNPGHACRSFWNSYCTAFYWSSSPGGGPNFRLGVNLGNSNPIAEYGSSFLIYCVRAFRCVTY